MIKLLMLISLILSVFIIRAQETIKYQYNGLDRILIVNCLNNTRVYYQYDELGNRISKVVTTALTNQPPIAHAGTDQMVFAGDLVTLDGSGSFDPEGVVISYLWSAPNGITLSSNTTQKPTFIAPTIAADTQYKFILVVSDGVLSSAPDTVVVFVKTQTIELHISTNEISNITETSAICGGIISADGGETITNRGICWNTTGNPTILDSHTSDGIGSGSFISTMSNLIENTTYFVRAYATNSAGTAYGNEISFKTVTGSSSISGKIFNDINFNGIYDEGIDFPLSIGWTVKLEGPASKTITPSMDGSYAFHNMPDGSYKVSLALPDYWTVIAPSNGGKHIIDMSENDIVENVDFATFNLLRDTSEPEFITFPYGLRTGINSVSSMSADAPLQSLPIDPTALPPGVRHLQISASGYMPQEFNVRENEIVLLALTSVDNWSHNIKFYDEKFRSVGVAVSAQTTRMVAFKVYDVKPGDVYNFLCDIPGHVGRGEYGSMIIIGTETLTPLLNTDVISSVTSTSAISGGNISSDNGSPVTTRGVCWSINANPTISNNKTSDGTGTGSFTSSITGLLPLTTYYVRAYATNSVATAYGNEVSFRTTEWLFEEVTNQITGKIWMDRNLGASRVATSSTDVEAYGNLYQWGRGTDGHEMRASATTSTFSSSDSPGHGNFIVINNSPYDWRVPQNNYLWQVINGINNPCPCGYRLPTESEWNEERLSWSPNNAAGAFASALKLPMAGTRDSITGSLGFEGSYSSYWSSTINSGYSWYLFFLSDHAGMFYGSRASGYSLRCIKDYATDLKQTALRNSIKIYPNPAHDELFIESNEYTSKIDFEIINFMAQTIYKSSFAGKTTIKISNFSPGIYLVKIGKGDSFFQEKIIKK